MALTYNYSIYGVISQTSEDKMFRIHYRCYSYVFHKEECSCKVTSAFQKHMSQSTELDFKSILLFVTHSNVKQRNPGAGAL